jgi:uncharacterized RDD family membrane protein YckC
MSANTLQTQMINPAVTEGVISRRVIAFLIDQLVIGCLVGIFYVVVFILGIATLGLAWGLFFILPGIWAVVALLYVFFTVSEQRPATWGMRSMEIEMRLYNGEPSYGMMAAFHYILFFVLTGVAVPLVITLIGLWLVPLFDKRRRTLHDIFSGTVMVRS